MTDNEIIKALECCSKITFSCDGCPLKHLKYSECYELVIRSTLDLINRQKAELSRAKDYIELLEIEKQALKEDSDKSKATAMGVIKRQDAEIERLEDLNKCYYSSCQQIAKSNHEIKAEAIKEFAERLRERGHGSLMCCINWVDFDDIDNLVKEMVGE